VLYLGVGCFLITIAAKMGWGDLSYLPRYDICPDILSAGNELQSKMESMISAVLKEESQDAREILQPTQKTEAFPPESSRDRREPVLDSQALKARA
jgi:hypothetical protein